MGSGLLTHSQPVGAIYEALPNRGAVRLQDLPRDLRLHETFELRSPELLPWVYVPIGCRNSECNQISCSSTDRSTPEPFEDGGSPGGISETPLLSGNTAGDRTAPAEVPNGGKGILTSSGSSGELLSDGRKAASDLFGARAVLQREVSCDIMDACLLETSRCLLGHTGVIEFLEVVQEAALAATVDNEPHQPSIRIWKLPAQGSESEDVRCTAVRN
ncbi:hypothetical protein Emag_001646 [Eimeria magna]